MRKITFDIETKNFFDTVHTNDPADLDISVVCLHDSNTDTYHSFTEDEFANMWTYFQNADLLITYNGNHFDIPCLQKLAPFSFSSIPHLDIFVEVRNSIGKRMSLDGIAQATLGISKSGHGSDAVAWWNAGEVQKIIDYCLQDVRVTKEVYDYAKQHNELFYIDRNTGDKKTITLDSSTWEESGTPQAQGGLF